MLHTFDNADAQYARRLDRERHLARMEELASRQLWDDDHDFNLAPAGFTDRDSCPRQSWRFPRVVSAAWTQCMMRNRLCRIVLGLLTLLAVAVGFSLGFRAGEGAVPLYATSAPELSLEDQNLRHSEHVFSTILDWGVTSQETLSDQSTAAARALQWMISHDTQTDNTEVMRTRYALATLYFSTQNVSSEFGVPSLWHEQTHWLSSYPVCLWHGIVCHDDENTLGRVKSINLTANGLGGTLPLEVGLLQLDLRGLDLSYNVIAGSLPSTLLGLRNLVELYLGPNLFTGTLSTRIGDLRHLTHLFLNDCSFSGSIPESIGDLHQLIGLGLYNNLLSGSIPDTIGMLETIRALYLDDNAINGTIPASLGELSRLADLRLRKNKITGPIPTSFERLTDLQILYLDNNALSGSLTGNLLGSLRIMRELHLYMNHITGTIPHEIGMLLLLKVLYLDSNKIFGPIPVSISNLRHLESLYVFHNKLSGMIPFQIGEMGQLESVRINANNLSGTLPPEVGNLVRLETLFLQNNALEGTVPPEWGDLKSLKKLRLHGTRINGTMPSPVCMLKLRELGDLTSDCKSTSIQCDCCTECY